MMLSRPLLLLLILGLGTGPARGREVWVSPNGNDANAGSKEAPLASVAAAQRMARNLRRVDAELDPPGVHIILSGGIYSLTEPLRFLPEDSGTSYGPTTIEAAPGEHPILSGGVAVTGWQKASGKIAGLPDAAQGNVWVANVPTLNGKMVIFRQLYVNGSKAVRARTPNGGTMEHLMAWDTSKQEATIPSASISAIKNPAGVEMLLEQQWEIAVLRLKTVRVEGDQAIVTFQQPESRIEFAHPWPQPVLPPKGSAAFFLANAMEFLDEPGEWFQEMPSGRIYYWPRPGEDLTRDAVVAPALESLVEVSGTVDRPVSYLSFKGISFEHATWMQPSEKGHVPLQAGMNMVESYKIKPKGTAYAPGLDNLDWVERLPAAVSVRGADHVTFERCDFEHTSASGLDFVTGTHDDVVEGCVFRDIGGSGIQLGSYQESPVETHVPYNPADPREICTHERIANNVVTDCANEDWGCVGIGVGYARAVTIEHNDVSNVSYTGISVGWGWTKNPNALRDNMVHANLLSHVATRLCDTAAIYTLSAQPGTVISENYVQLITMSPYVDLPEHWFYLYTDEGTSFITVRDNWCSEEKFLKNANGPGNTWTNNGPMVSEQIKNAAGLEPAFKDLLEKK